MSEFVLKPYTSEAFFDLDGFLKATEEGIKYLDHIIDINMNRHPLPEQRKNSKNYRNIGLGVFGFGTALMKLGIKYGSQQAIKFTDETFNEMFRTAIKVSSNLAKQYGSFPMYSENADAIWESQIIKRHFSEEEIAELKKNGLRNCSVLSIAPTGSLATLLGETGGVEPEFAISYTRRTVGMTNNEDHYYKVYCKAAKEYMSLHNTEELPDYFVGASQVNPMDRVRTQAAMQNHIDTAISSTVNLPESATEEMMQNIYLEAWKQGLKGLTIFRDNCKKAGILTVNTSKKKEIAKSPLTLQTLPRGAILDCSDNLIGLKRKLQTGCGSLHTEAFFDPDSGELREVWLSKGSTGGCNSYMVGLSRMISIACRGGVDIHSIVDQLNSTPACPSYAARNAVSHDCSKGQCCPAAVGNALINMYNEFQARFIDEPEDEPEEAEEEKNDVLKATKKPEAKKIVNTTTKNNSEKCPQCGEPIIHTNGCISCPSCGWSKC